MLTTTRVIESAGLGDKSTIEWSDGNRRKAGLAPAKDEIASLRERWAVLTNEALEAAHRQEWVDHRTLEAQGIDREPTKHMGPAVAAIVDRGRDSWLVARWQEEAVRRLQLAKDAGEFDREHRQVSQGILDLTQDVGAGTSGARRAEDPDAHTSRSPGEGEGRVVGAAPDQGRSMRQGPECR